MNKKAKPLKKNRLVPTAKWHDLDSLVVTDLIVPAKAWTALGDLVDIHHYRDLGEPIREGIRMVIQQNAQALLAKRTAIAARMIAQAVETNALKS